MENRGSYIRDISSIFDSSGLTVIRMRLRLNPDESEYLPQRFQSAKILPTWRPSRLGGMNLRLRVFHFPQDTRPHFCPRR